MNAQHYRESGETLTDAYIAQAGMSNVGHVSVHMTFAHRRTMVVGTECIQLDWGFTRLNYYLGSRW